MPTQGFPDACILQRHLSRPVWRNFQSLFSGLTLLKVLPDFESYKDRRDSSELSKYQECFDKMGVAMVAISDQPSGSSEFIKYTDWQGELYLDINHEVCLGAADSSSKSFVRRQTSKISSRLNRKQSHDKALFKLGGTYVVTPDFQVIYSHEPKSLIDCPSIGFILNLCRSYIAASKKMPNSVLPVFTQASLAMRSPPRNRNSSETNSSSVNSLPSPSTSTHFYLNDDFTSVFG